MLHIASIIYFIWSLFYYDYHQYHPSATYSLCLLFLIYYMPAHSTITLDTKFKLCIIKDNNDAIFPVSFMTLRKICQIKKRYELKNEWLAILLGRFEYSKDVDRDRTNFMGLVEYVCVLPPSPWRIFKLKRLRDFAAKSSCKNHARILQNTNVSCRYNLGICIELKVRVF